ncbi:lytic polysaccharide monooxygenase [Actinoplanes derwentensis]|uniref:Chitin-binding protein n=1 Tax=Actinoplanes derwentensis TaxID=113562 RepID=A0A1H2CXI7_9ACTN|nr:lytic polysaccharide monooxygenase [Actinoplanes derwentensis]GID87914.1 cellulose-binding protein [Actinoplanes derwentensis]SDT75007.1 chitin-binding protein [Actinoplanes derwentensis]
MRRMIAYPLATLGMVASSLAVASSPAMAHGYVSSPPSRQALCAAGTVADCGAIQFEPQSVEAPKGSKQCNGGNSAFPVLNDESKNWPAATVGKSATFNWVLTARHRTATWEYFVDGTSVATFDDKNAIPAASVSHTVDLSRFSGKKTVLAVWNIGDTPMAFYNCVDVNIGGSGSGGSTPTTPTTAPTTTPPSTGAPTTPPATTPTTAPTKTAAPTATSGGSGSAWAPGVTYKTGDKVTYEGVTYQCRQGHSAIRSWEPGIWTLALWLPL